MYHALNTSIYHHLPSIAGQHLMTLHHMLPDTPTHRTNVANTMKLEGTRREIYLYSYLHVGENHKAPAGQIESVRDFMTHIPRVIFPDAILTLNHYVIKDLFRLNIPLFELCWWRHLYVNYPILPTYLKF